MRARARQRERLEKILLAYVPAIGPELVPPPDLLARIREQVPDVTLEEVDAAITWSLRQSRHKGAELEAAMLRERDAMGDNIIKLMNALSRSSARDDDRACALAH